MITHSTSTAFIQDITKVKRLGEEQKKSEQQRQHIKKAESLNTMAGAVAHHFNNQLGAVMGNLEIALDDLPKDTDIAQILTAAQEAARKAAEVSRQMLILLGQTTGRQAPLDLSDICRQSLPLLQASTPKKTLFTSDFPAPGPTISADANQIQQVLINLVTNAWEAAGEGMGAINLTVKMVSAADIPASHRFPVDWEPQDLTYACMEVADTSGGIADGDIEKLFDPFFSSKFPGRGLGLAGGLGDCQGTRWCRHGGKRSGTKEHLPGLFSGFFRSSLPAAGKSGSTPGNGRELHGAAG